MDKQQLLYQSEDGEVIGLDEVQLLDPIPERIAPLHELLAGPDEYDAYQAALILAAWGDPLGVRHLMENVLAGPAGKSPLDPHRIRATEDDAPDLAAEALHLFGMTGGDVRVRDEGYRRCLDLFGEAHFAGKLQSALRRDRPASLLAATRAAYDRAAGRGLDTAAASLLPALVAMGEPGVISLIEDCSLVVRNDAAIQRGLLDAASAAKRNDIAAIVRGIASAPG